MKVAQIYIDSLSAFEIATGFCMVQGYKDALSLAVTRDFTLPEVKQIAGAVLKILVYLQNCIPPVLHRDIKPENILLDNCGNVTLVDFGFARIGGNDLAASSVVMGTSGFMPPEQLLGRQLTEASDLYSLGATLICLLAGIKSANLGDFIDETYSINVKYLLPNLDSDFRWWLGKMVAPRVSDRFSTAAAAIAALDKRTSSKTTADILSGAIELKPQSENQTKIRINVGEILGAGLIGLVSVGLLLGISIAINWPGIEARNRILTECFRPLFLAENAATAQTASIEVDRSIRGCSNYTNSVQINLGLADLKTERNSLNNLTESDNPQKIRDYKTIIHRARTELSQEICQNKNPKWIICP